MNANKREQPRFFISFLLKLVNFGKDKKNLRIWIRNFLNFKQFCFLKVIASKIEAASMVPEHREAQK